MKRFFCFLVTICLLGCILLYREKIINYLLIHVIYPNEFVIENKNYYAMNNSFQFVQTTENFTPTNKQELLNIFYTILNNGWEEFSFVCDLSYTTCTQDIQDILDNPTLLSDINNFVHPYNSYDEMQITMNSLGKIDVFIDKVYSEEDIALIEAARDTIKNKMINDTMSTEEKIKVIHDYIINTTVYAKEDATSGSRDTKSNTAYGALLEHTASCGGYTDAMALFLYDFGVLNYRISSETHIWNLVSIDGGWKHLDLTWDDPVTDTGENVLLDKFFLIDTNQLESLNVIDHSFDKNIFIEAS